MHYYNDGWMWMGGSWIFMLIFWALVIWLVVYLVSKKSPSNNDSLEILKSRLAKGEINKKEFYELKKELKKS